MQLFNETHWKVFQCYASQACRDFLTLAQTHSKRWQKALQAEREQRVRLEETLEQLAKQHNHLERAFRGAAQANASPDNKGKLWFWQDNNEGWVKCLQEGFYCNTSTYFVNLTSDLHTISKKSKLTLKIIKTKLKLIFQTTKTKLKYENRFWKLNEIKLNSKPKVKMKWK